MNSQTDSMFNPYQFTEVKSPGFELRSEDPTYDIGTHGP